jgi:ferredoxin--NADP+ reductase
MTAVITSRVDLTADLWKIRLAPARPFLFTPGQYCTIGTGGVERPYSIASAPHEDELELFLELVPPPHGTLTPLLHQLPVGAEVTLRPHAKGRFALRPEFRHHVCIATVTGIAPYVSMLRSHLHRPTGAPQFHVLDGASYADELGYAAELGDYAAEHAFVHYVPSVSRPGDARNVGWAGATGRINTLVEQHLATHTLAPDDTCIYACGHPAMIEDVRTRVGGVYTVEFERFWNDDEPSRERRGVTGGSR